MGSSQEDCRGGEDVESVSGVRDRGSEDNGVESVKRIYTSKHFQFQFAIFWE